MKQNYTRVSYILKYLVFSLFILSTVISTSVFAQTLTLQSPNGGEVWTYGGVEIATWTGQNLSGLVNIEFSNDGGTNWWYFGQVPSGPNGGNASISVPGISTTNAILRISDLINPEATDTSDAPFTVFIPPIYIWEPSGISAVFANSPVQIYWILNVPGITLLNAEISTDNGQTFTPVAQNLDALSSYTYIELSETPADECILKLYNAENPSEFAMSAVFKINPLPVYTLTSPIGGEIVDTYSPFTITWDVANPYSVNCFLEYSTNNGVTWEFFGSGYSIGFSGSYEWITPNAESDECLIRISDYYAFSNDVSAPFTILDFPETPVCMVSVDSLTNQNFVIWEKPVSDLIADFLIYKETDEANVYEIIDTVSYEDVPMVNDPESNPSIRPYRYKIGIMDSENRVFPAGDYHQTIHLTINQGVNGNWNLIWTPYTGFDYNSYKIMRKANNGFYEQIATVSSSFNSFTDFNAPSGDIAYMLKIVNPDSCNNLYADVYSNRVSASLVSVGDIGKSGFSVYPVPAKDQLNIQFGDNTKGIINLTITDVTGRIVISEEYTDMVAGQLLLINTSDYAEGMYLLNVLTSGERIAKKFVISH